MNEKKEGPKATPLFSPKSILSLLIIGILSFVLYSVFSTDLLDPVEGQIEAIRENKITEAYYDYTSEKFQKNTNLASFHKFINENPTLAQNKFASFYERSIKNGIGTLSGVLISKDDSSNHVKFTLVKEGATWKILSIQLSSPKEAPDETQEKTPDNVIGPITSQLHSLKQHDTATAYYQNSTKEFQNSVPYTAFDNFIKRHPSFGEYKQTDIKEPTVVNDQALVSVVLDSDRDIFPIEYRLKKEEGQWKIETMKVVNPPQENPLSSYDSPSTPSLRAKPLTNLIQAHVNAIKNKEFSKAYKHTSQDFQKNNELHKFSLFVRKQPILLENDGFQFENIKFKNNIATVLGILHSPTGEIFPIEYSLIQENNQWKISYIELFPPSQDQQLFNEKHSDPSSLAFTKITIGTEVDPKGTVLEPKKSISSPYANIYVNLYVHNGDPQDRIQLVLNNQNPLTNPPALYATPSKTGDSILSFEFSPPYLGWPAGKYQITAIGENGTKTNYQFEIKQHHAL